MQVWSNTPTLDGHVAGISFTEDKASAEIVLIGVEPIDLDDFPRLLGIFRTGVGRDNVPVEEARSRGIVCGFPSNDTAAIIYEETSNFACHLVLRSLYVDLGDFQTWRKTRRVALGKKRLLVVGTGNIGGRMAEKMRTFVQVDTFDIASDAMEALEPLMREADCVSLHIPLTPQTRGFVDAGKLSWMKDGAALVNTARGPIVDENGFFEEVSNGRLRAAFDVFWEEPYKGRFMELPRDRFIVPPTLPAAAANSSPPRRRTSAPPLRISPPHDLRWHHRFREGLKTGSAENGSLRCCCSRWAQRIRRGLLVPNNKDI